MASSAADYQPAWLLHSRPYRETSALAWLLTLEEGRVDAVVRGVRSRKSRYRALLQPFTPLQVNLKGHHQLRTLVGLESTSAPHWFQGEALVCGLYANELLSRLLLPGQACADLFRDYSLLLNLLSNAEQREPALRRLEFTLLETLGYAPAWQSATGETLVADWYYSYRSEEGFVPCLPTESGRSGQPVFTGAQLLAIAADDWRLAATRQAGKHLTRQLLQPLLGQRPLQSRQLFKQLVKNPSRSKLSE
ncbi:DNA replication and repair protein RecO [Marinospirillum celere]|uniref:DNA repair protein RecO n=1 Tax=Marinospirillum celere TaxID=1122252 RepID=A0A1I1G0F1_9GAMM|nr:DNA repair protein RecO [Marinospirillum celere]SFC02783.1 DNA replication and repair protein RecO [Marinospirillum celere]